MASEERQPDDALRNRLEREGHRFEFFHAVVLLHRLAPMSVPVGELGPPGKEPVRFRHDPRLVFHAGDVARIRFGGDGRAELMSSFLGLTGAVSPLATALAEDVLQAELAEEAGLAEFYDLFHHRILSLLYRAWKKYRFTASFRLGGNDPFTRRAASFVGVDLAGAVASRGLPPVVLLSLAPLMSLRTRPARSLELVLNRLFGDVPVRIESFVARSVQIPADQQVRLGLHHSTIGVDYTIGPRVEDRTGRFRIHVGPVPYDACDALMPGGQHFPLLRDVVAQFSRGILEAELEVHLDEHSAPAFQLCSERSGLLGVNTRISSSSARRARMRVLLSDRLEESRPQLVAD